VPRASIPLLFDLHSDEITSQNADQLREIAIALQDLDLKGSRDLKLVEVAPENDSKEEKQLSQPEQKIVLEGYTCDLGNEDDNLVLSKERAKSVKAFLVGAGFDPDLIEVKGYGEKFPVAENTTEENRMKNRRVEIVLSHADPEINN
jgi:outer membrane protein OmpA-like peptidoglycan-associated protein